MDLDDADCGALTIVVLFVVLPIAIVAWLAFETWGK